MPLTDQNAENVVGAFVFYAYICAALFFTSFICRDLVSLYAETHNAKFIKQKSLAHAVKTREKAQFFVTLAFISFAVLSYHMLSFLIGSYSEWSHLSNIPLPVKFLGSKGILDLERFQTSLYPWIWAKRSTLFQDFAETIVNDRRRYWWTQQALLYSLGWNTFMAVQGRRYQVPHLWAYYVLDQILPISFTQNLFCAAISLSPNLPEAASLRAAAPGDQFIVTFLYVLGLSSAPAMVGTKSFFVLLFGIRALLFAPYWMLRPKSRNEKGLVGGSAEGLFWQYRYVAMVLIIAGLFLHFRQTQLSLPLVDTVRAVHDNPAVSALGYDYIIASASLFVGILASRF